MMITKLWPKWALCCIKDGWKKYYLDFHMLLFWIGMGITIYSFFPALYQLACFTVYPDDRQVCKSILPTELEDPVQTLTARWSLYIELARFIPCIFSVTLISKYGDEHGVKIPILLAIASQIVQIYFYIVGISLYHPWGITVLLINTFVTSLGGTTTVFLSAQFAEAGRITPNPDDLVYRYTILAACWNLGSFIVGNIVPELFDIMPYSNCMLIGQAIMVTSFLSAVYCYRQQDEMTTTTHVEKTLQTHQSMDTLVLSKVAHENYKTMESVPSSVSIASNETLETTDGASVSNETTEFETPQETKIQKKLETCDNSLSAKLLSMLKKLGEIYKEAWLTFCRKREGNKRAYVIIVLIIGLIYASTDVGLDSILTLYVYRSPLSWSPNAYARYKSLMDITQLVGSLISAYIFNRLKLSDTMVVFISLLTAVVKIGLISIAWETWMMYLSLGIGCISTVGFSGLKSFIALLGSQEEIGSLLGLQMLTMSWSLIFGAAVFNNMYTATLQLYAGFSFGFTAFLLVLCSLAILFVHFDYKKHMKKTEKLSEKVTKF